MKIRKGFISNSSSSSFVITSKEELNEDNLLENSGIKESFIFYDLFKDVIQSICSNAKELKTEEDFYKYYGKYDSLQKLIEYYDDGDLEKAVKNFTEKNHHLYVGGFASDSDGLEAGLCEVRFNVDKEDFLFLQSGGY